jgi:NAD(P)-dependent dehydrogenase (short-subunit alcohol dehydrogenase family)
MDSMFSLKDKVAVITGGTGELGGIMARGLMKAGAKVYITGRELHKVEAQAELYGAAAGGQCIALHADLNSAEGIATLAKELGGREEGIDILINNAASTKVAPFAETTFADWQMILTTNVSAVFELSKVLLPLLKKRASRADPSRIVNLGSALASHAGAANSFAYATSKAALEHLSKNLANELASQFIAVNCLSPGVFPSPMFDQYLSEEFGLKDIEAAMPMQKMGQESDLAGTIVYMCSPASAYMTGANIALDGGDSIRW